MASGPDSSSPSHLTTTASTLSLDAGSSPTRRACSASDVPIPAHHAAQTQAHERLNRRESKLGLRSILSRSRIIRQSDAPTSPRRGRDPSDGRHPLESEAESSRVPYSSPYSKTIAVVQPPRPLTATAVDEDSSVSPSFDSAKPVVPRIETKSGAKGDSISIEATPLYKAYPQAVRYATLPGPVASADSLIKAQEKRSNGEPVAIPADQPQGKLGPWRKHRRSKSGPASGEWTRNVYILTLSGWLLEYAGEGPFDRLPQKVVRLSKTSAAFATDLIPGRHWVLHVSCSMGSDGVAVATPDPGRSFLSRLPFRGGLPLERRTTSNMLLVCESAEDMDGWLASLRGAIQALGGRKSVSETGKPQPEMTPAQLRGQASQRTLVHRDSANRSSINRDSARYSARYSHNSGHSELPWEQHLDRRGSDAPYSIADAVRNQSMDEMSATNSFISHDGQQLESLRSSQNRLSYVSSGQRTMITSTTSSPGCSPTIDTFPSQSEDPQSRHLDAHYGEVKLRPNSAAILDRRKSLQSPSPLCDADGGQQGQRPRSTYAGVLTLPDQSSSSSSQALAPNFSVPSNRRYMSNRTSLIEGASLPSFTEEADSAGRGGNRRPPTALKISRPLSMVADQPSPKEGIPDRPTTGHGEYRTSSSPQHSQPQSPTTPTEAQVSLKKKNTPPKADGGAGIVSAVRKKPRRLASFGTLHQRRSDTMLVETPILPDLNVRTQNVHIQQVPAQAPLQPKASVPERRYSAMGRYGRSDSFGSLPSRGGVRRSSMQPYISDVQQQLLEAIDPQSLPLPAPPPTVPLPPLPPLSDDQLKLPTKPQQGLMNRRSMPQLTEGSPAPAPPPNLALPPLPKIPSSGA